MKPADETSEFTFAVTREFHRRMALAIDAVQEGIWKAGAHDLIGYSTDYGFGQKHGVQTLVLKTRRRSAYLRLHWDTILGDSAEQRTKVSEAIASAITELA
jgi:hypothetical protein